MVYGVRVTCVVDDVLIFSSERNQIQSYPKFSQLLNFGDACK